MAYDILAIGPAPSEESCAQVGDPDYPERSRRECRVFLRMLLRLFPASQSLEARLVVKTFPHDFGRYREVCVQFAPSSQEALGYAYHIESNAPARWDTLARYELAWLERQGGFLIAIERGDIRPSELPANFRRADIPALPLDATLPDLLAAFAL